MTPGFLLDDPEGNTWCMKSASLIVDPDQTYESLKDLGSRLKPAEGWSFRDLVLTADDGSVNITQPRRRGRAVSGRCPPGMAEAGARVDLPDVTGGRDGPPDRPGECSLS